MERAIEFDKLPFNNKIIDPGNNNMFNRKKDKKLLGKIKESRLS